MKNNLVKTFKQWLPLGVLATIMCLTVYVSVQQNYRLNANDPQIQYVDEISSYLADGQATPEEIVGSQKVDIKKSMSPFVIIFGADKKAVASGATLNQNIPVPPTSSFNEPKSVSFLGFTIGNSQNRFSWQPEKGVRVATVMAPYKKDGKIAGYILAGKNIDEIEQRIDQLGLIVALGWLLSMITTFLAIFIFIPKTKEKI